jgi:hypothetical protein
VRFSPGCACCGGPVPCSFCASLPDCLAGTFDAPGLSIDGAVIYAGKNPPHFLYTCTTPPASTHACGANNVNAFYSCADPPPASGVLWHAGGFVCSPCNAVTSTVLARLICCTGDSIRVAYLPQVGNNSQAACQNIYDASGNLIWSPGGWNTLPDCTNASVVALLPTLNVISTSPFLAVPSFKLQFQQRCVDCGSASSALVPVGLVFTG